MREHQDDANNTHVVIHKLDLHGSSVKAAYVNEVDLANPIYILKRPSKVNEHYHFPSRHHHKNSYCGRVGHLRKKFHSWNASGQWILK